MSDKTCHVFLEALPFAAFNPQMVAQLKARADVKLSDFRDKTAEAPGFMEQFCKAEVILAGNVVQFTEEMFSSLPKLKLIAKLGVGLDMIDIPAATRHGVMICNTPGSNDVAVAEQTFAMLLAYLRQIIRCDAGMRKGLWEQAAIMGTEIAGKTLGIIGLGTIGRRVATRAVGFEARVIAHDPFWPEEFAAKHGIERKTLPEVMAESDFVCVHCPLTKETANCISTKELALMKPAALLVNMARGGIVDEEALLETLKAKRIAGAILDAFSQEPPVNSPFASLDNVLLSPHNGAFTVDAMTKMDTGAMNQILDYLDGKTPKNLRNPEVLN